MRWIVAAAAIAALLACGGDHPRDWGRADTATMLSELSDTLPGDDADTLDDGAIPPPMLDVVAPADSAAGDAIFHRRGQCFTCHGAGGTGIDRLGPSLRDGVWLHTDGSLAGIAGIISSGVAAPRVAPIAMPGFVNQLSESEILQVAAYVYSLSHPGSTWDGRVPLPDQDTPQR